MPLPDKFIIILGSLFLLAPLTTYADIKIYFNIPSHHHHSKPAYYPADHNRYKNHRRQRRAYFAYPAKSVYLDVNKKYYRHNYRHHAIEQGYYDYQQYKETYFKNKRQHYHIVR